MTIDKHDFTGFVEMSNDRVTIRGADEGVKSRDGKDRSSIAGRDLNKSGIKGTLNQAWSKVLRMLGFEFLVKDTTTKKEYAINRSSFEKFLSEQCGGNWKGKIVSNDHAREMLLGFIKSRNVSPEPVGNPLDSGSSENYNDLIFGPQGARAGSSNKPAGERVPSHQVNPGLHPSSQISGGSGSSSSPTPTPTPKPHLGDDGSGLGLQPSSTAKPTHTATLETIRQDGEARGIVFGRVPTPQNDEAAKERVKQALLKNTVGSDSGTFHDILFVVDRELNKAAKEALKAKPAEQQVIARRAFSGMEADALRIDDTFENGLKILDDGEKDILKDYATQASNDGSINKRTLDHIRRMINK